MFDGAEEAGTSITAYHDTRVTRVGKILRKFKLDEFPQFIDVLLGNMSLVGPRPEVPKYSQYYPEIITSVKPGITDYASIFFEDEASLLADTDETEKKYIESIIPTKVELQIRYIKTQTLIVDFQILYLTVKSLLFRW